MYSWFFILNMNYTPFMVDGEYNYLLRNKPLRSSDYAAKTMKLLKLVWLYVEVNMIKITIVQQNRTRKHIATDALLNYIIPIQSTDRDIFYILLYSNIECIHVPRINRTGYGSNIKKKKRFESSIAKGLIQISFLRRILLWSKNLL